MTKDPDDNLTQGPDEKALSYDGALEQLQQILTELESDDVDVDLLATRVEQANDLIRLCQKRLTTVELQVERVIEALDAD